MNTSLRTLTAAAAALILLSGCTSAADDEAAPVEDTLAPPATSRPADEIAADFYREVHGEDDHITDVEVSEPGRITIYTDLQDPGRPTSPEAMFALSLCEAAARVDGVEYVTVHELDGTTWALYGHPAFPAGECSIP